MKVDDDVNIDVMWMQCFPANSALLLMHVLMLIPMNGDINAYA